MEPFDVMYKILLIGDAGVGKTVYLTRYCDDTFNPSYISTVGIDFRIKTVERNDKRIKLQIWDTAGQERYQAITRAYYPGAMGFIVMFDLTNRESFEACRNWVESVKELSANPAILLIANKRDLEDQREVVTEEIEVLSASLGIHFFETSTKDDINIQESIEYLVDLITQNLAEK